MLTLSGWLTTQVPPASRPATEGRLARAEGAAGEPPESQASAEGASERHVRISQAGRELAATRGVPPEDDDEDIPQELRPMVKMIRELKQKIEEKLKELQEAMGSSDPGVRQNRLPALQKELQQLNSALQTATAALAKAIKEMGLSDPALIMKMLGGARRAGIRRPAVRAGRRAVRSPGRSAGG